MIYRWEERGSLLMFTCLCRKVAAGIIIYMIMNFPLLINKLIVGLVLAYN